MSLTAKSCFIWLANMELQNAAWPSIELVVSTSLSKGSVCDAIDLAGELYCINLMEEG
jgi:hypothetical protein